MWRRKYTNSILCFRLQNYSLLQLPKEADKFVHCDRINDKKEEVKEDRIIPDEKRFNKFKATNIRHIKNHLKSFLIWDLSKRLSDLGFKSGHSIKSNCLKYVVKKYYHQEKTCKLIV